MALSALIVDDEQLSRSYIRNMLRSYNEHIVIFEAGSSKDALRIFGGEHIDILFLDIKMPETDGFGLLQLLPHRNFQLVFITAYNQHAIRAIKEGAADYLLKPIKKTDFTETLERVIKRREQFLHLTDNGPAIQQLSKVEEQLAEYVRNNKEKNELIEQLKNEIEQLQGPADDKIAVLNTLQKNAILTEDDWNVFKEKFESVYPEFFFHLKGKYATLTQAETRLMALTKLNMGTREMAAMLGISPETIRQTRWRLRKKMHLPDDISLEQLVASV